MATWLRLLAALAALLLPLPSVDAAYYSYYSYSRYYYYSYYSYSYVSVGTIIGAVVGGLMALGLLIGGIFVICCCVCQANKKTGARARRVQPATTVNTVSLGTPVQIGQYPQQQQQYPQQQYPPPQQPPPYFSEGMYPPAQQPKPQFSDPAYPPPAYGASSSTNA